MGSLYTSFAAIQLAKQTNGICYLRIEDTDGQRTVLNGVQGIIDDFKSLGINFDEGCGFGGEFSNFQPLWGSRGTGPPSRGSLRRNSETFLVTLLVTKE